MVQSSLRLFLEDLHGDGHEPVQFIVRRLRQQRLGPDVILGPAVPLEEPPNEGEQRDPLQLSTPFGVAAVLRAPHGGFEALGVPERLRRQGGDDLAEAHIAVREGVGIALRAEEDRPDDRAPPTDRNDDDRADVPEVEERLDVREHGIVRGIGDEHRLSRLERALKLRIAIEIDDEIANRRILVAGDQPNVAGLAGEEDRAAVEPEGLAQLACDRLQNVYEMEGGRDFLENVDERDQLVTLALQLRDLSLQPGDLPTRG